MLFLSRPQLQVLLHVQLVGHEQLNEVDDAAEVVLLLSGEIVDPGDEVRESNERPLRSESEECLAGGLEFGVAAL